VREAEGVARAREALRGGRAAEALAILGELDRTIRGGALGQERAVYAIEALAATGRATEAQQAARAFLAANPSSPYAARIERFVTH
jgi:outer membrane protein assembly factor BamD (BamD/ComL family)